MNIVLLIASIASSVLGADANIPADIKNLVTAISSALSALVKSGVTTGPSTSTILAALEGVVLSLKAIPSLPVQTLDIIADIDQAVQAAVAADKLAVAGPVNPANVQPITPV